MNGYTIPNGEKYEDIGKVMDKKLCLTENFQKMFSGVKLLSLIRHNINPCSAETIYKVMILPIMLYCSNIFVSMLAPKNKKLDNIQERALKIINGQRKIYIQLPSVNHSRNKRCTIEVIKCLSGLAPTAFEDYFKWIRHVEMNTR